MLLMCDSFQPICWKWKANGNPEGELELSGLWQLFLEQQLYSHLAGLIKWSEFLNNTYSLVMETLQKLELLKLSLSVLMPSVMVLKYFQRVEKFVIPREVFTCEVQHPSRTPKLCQTGRGF